MGRVTRYTYGPGSLEDRMFLAAAAAAPAPRGQMIRVSGINRGRIRGSFLISAFARIGDERRHLGTEAVLSRWHVEGCANCQTHVEARAFFGLHDFRAAAPALASTAAAPAYEVEVRTRDGLLDQPRTAAAAMATSEQKPFRVEVRL